ncbi:MAG: sulfatase-like hydrolase/transferase [Planctomycetia bacterium]
MPARLGSVGVGWLAVFVGLSIGSIVRPALADPARPNVVVILADDLGFSDLGAYGGEIDTPHLDRLARGGLRFTQATNTARCWPSRAALLTGFYPQAIHRDALPAGDGHEALPGGAQGKRPPWAQLLPEILAPAGYRSYHSGKWHVDGLPLAQGFSRSLDVTGTGQSNFFDPSGVTVEGKPYPQSDDFYATTAIGDHAVACLTEHSASHAGEPFFHFVAFTAPHFPLQAPQAGIAKYRERYREGWETIRAARHARQLAAGIVSGALSKVERDLGPPYPFPDALHTLGPGEVELPLEWERLTPEQQDFQATKMAIHAAMVEAMDEQVGRIVAALEAMQRLDDTLILFASDNGASAEIMVRGEGHDPAAPPGSRKSFLCLGPGWSSAANTPFRRHKTWVHEGGIATPWIVHWPRGIPAGSAGELRHQPVHLIDVTPTVMALAGVEPPARRADGTLVPAMQGGNFFSLLADATAPPLRETSWWCHEGHRAVRLGEKKLVAAKGEPWALHDLAADRAETTDLAAAEPDTVARLEREWERIAAECRALAAGALVAPAAAAPPHRPPNVVIVFADDLGYGDPACYGGKAAATPHLDRLAREGVRFTDFHVAQPVCSASRAALLTGCYPNRIGIAGALGPNARHGIAAAETTLAEALRGRGYRTGMVGKWHLGHHAPFLPTRHGFDEWFGLPYSNDMWPHHPEAAAGSYPPLPLFDGERIIDDDVTPEDQATLTARYAERACAFLDRAKEDDRPFFLYLAHSMPHVPLFAGATFAGTTPGGLYGDVLAEIDASVGGILAALERTGKLDDTLVLFTSDNGPWLSYGNHAGSAGNLREGKGTVFEGGVRVPCLARLPGVIPAGSVCTAPAMTIDILPTVLRLTGEPVPVDADGRGTLDGRRIDGHDISGLLRGEPAASAAAAEREYGFWYLDNELQAVRRGRSKLLLPHTARTLAGAAPGAASGADGVPAKYRPLPVARMLFDLDTDPAETTDVAADHPEVVAQLEAAALRLRGDLGDRLTGVIGSEVRPAGQLDEAPPTGAQRRPPNIIVVMTDDQGYGDLAAHGNPILKTPHLDRMWRESVRFTEYHVSPTCSPTRTALLTGRHEFRSGVTHTIHERERLALSATTLPQLLRAAGYTTGIFGKWHLGDEEAYQPGKRGFDRSVIHGAGGIGQRFPGSCGDVPGNRYVDPVLREDGRFVKRLGYCTDLFFAAGIAWIEEMARADKPFFCLITPNAPHDPLDCPEGSDAGPRARLAAAGMLDEAGRDRVAKFYGMIENIDTNVGRLLDRLEASGRAEDTLLIFSTDNGTATGAGVFNDSMRGAKGSVWRGGTRVPALWRWPGTLPAGVDVPALVAHLDILPTLCEIARAPIPADVAVRLEGRSLVPLLLDAHSPWPDRPLVTHLGRWERGEVAGAKWRHCRIREGRWSLVNVDNRPEAWQLFDGLADPAEMHDVAAAHGAIVKRLAAEYDRWWDSIQPDLVNEDLDGPPENPFKTAFEVQVGVGMTAATVAAP